ncbi:MAG: flavin reductase family protein [Clostridia bacterium]|nr:flavin reductase family protein [Clostridia bacterium]
MQHFTRKQALKPSTFLSPVPVVMVTCGSMEKPNIITLAWAGTVNSEPPMLSISVRKSRYSHSLIRERGTFGVNLVSQGLCWETDYCGVKSGRDVDKFKDTGLTCVASPELSIPMIAEAPVHLECKVREVLELGSHDLFIADIAGVQVAEALMDRKGAVDMRKADLVAYNHGEYYSLGKILGFFGYSIAGKDVLKRRKRTRLKEGS